jgi:nicotinamidase-related amidase
MSQLPATLLEIAGAPRHPSPPDAAVLILIDHQEEYRSGFLPLSGIEAAVAEAGRLLRFARDRGIPVFHIVHHGRPGAALFDPDGPGVAILPELTPEAGEPVLVKHLPNSFAGTGLADAIRATGRTELILAGFATHMCVASTARGALDLGLRCTVVADATATRDLADPLGGGIVPAGQVRRAALAALADRFAVIVRDTTAYVSAVS